MRINLYPHQSKVLGLLRSGSILMGRVGSGKSRAALAYFFVNVVNGGLVINGKGNSYPPKKPIDLYIITTSKKRDSLEWEGECIKFGLSVKRELSMGHILVTIDSWNNIKKYSEIKNAFFIFDEQRLVGNGSWVKTFYNIAKSNKWIMLSGTPGDTWMDYIPVFVANGFYKNKTDFLRQHVIFSRFAKYPKVERYTNTGKLTRLRNQIIVKMVFEKKTCRHQVYKDVTYSKELYKVVRDSRWNPYKDAPVKQISELIYTERRVVNSDPSRIEVIKKIFDYSKRLIIFYNFDYELEQLRFLKDDLNVTVAEWNGHKHQEVPQTNEWLYFVQYTAGAEAWNCTDTDTIIFYSFNYSYRITEQAEGRIDRINTPFIDLWYYFLRSDSPIDAAIYNCLRRKKNFNAKNFKP